MFCFPKTVQNTHLEFSGHLVKPKVGKQKGRERKKSLEIWVRLGHDGPVGGVQSQGVRSKGVQGRGVPGRGSWPRKRAGLKKHLAWPEIHLV